MDKQAKITTICLFAVNFIIGEFISQSEFNAVLQGFFSVCVYWFGEYYFPEIAARFEYWRCKGKDDNRIYFFINYVSEQMKKIYDEQNALESAIDMRLRDPNFNRIYNEFAEVIFDMHTCAYGDKINLLDPRSRNYSMNSWTKNWLYEYGYRGNNIEELVEELPVLTVRLRNIEMRKALDSL